MTLTATEPLEVYTFQGSFTTYRYTSSDTPVTVDGFDYERVPISRGVVRAGDQTQDQLDVEIRLPADTQVVRDYAFLNSPPKLNLVLQAFNRPDNISANNFASANGVILWSGEVTSFSVTNRNARLKVPSNFSRSLRNDVPSVYWQNPCNHVLYDARCKVNRSAFSSTTNVASVSGTQVGVVTDGAVNGFLQAGEIVNNRTGERRLIVDNVDDVITIALEFVDIQTGDEVELAAGCDHSFTTCRTKFNNTINYGGHPYIPGDNPFRGRL